MEIYIKIIIVNSCLKQEIKSDKKRGILKPGHPIISSWT